MRPLRLPLLLATLVLTVSGPRPNAWAAPGKKTPDAPYPLEFQSRVKKAIERGVTHLRTGQIRERSSDIDMAKIQFEEAAAVTWVLRRAGVESSEPALVEAGRRLRERPPKTIDEASLVLLALCTEPLASGNPFSVETSAKTAEKPPSLPAEDRSLIESTVKLVLERQVKSDRISSTLGRQYDDGGGWGTEFDSMPGKATSSDIPSTYLALLALEAATRTGIKVPPSHFLAALELLLGWQAPKGPAVSLAMNEVRGTDRFEWTEKAKARGFGWGGTMSDKPTGYETVAGALGLVICQDALQKQPGFTKALQKSTREGLRDALAWVQQNYDIKRNPTTGGKAADIGGSLYHHHWFQGLARLAIHARMRLIGTHDWYQEGAQVLLETQRSDGAWNAIWWDNCYSLLFLLRASLPSIVPVVTPSEQAGK